MTTAAAINPTLRAAPSPQGTIRQQGSASFQRELDSADMRATPQGREDAPAQPQPDEPQDLAAPDEADTEAPAEEAAEASTGDVEDVVELAAQSQSGATATASAVPALVGKSAPAAAVAVVPSAAASPAAAGTVPTQEAPADATASPTPAGGAAAVPALEGDAETDADVQKSAAAPVKPTTLGLPGPQGGSVPTPSVDGATAVAAPAPAAEARAAATESLLPPPPSPSDMPDDANAARVARGLRSAVNQNGGVITLRLTPPELGEVRIQMQVQHSHVSAQLQVEQDSVQTLLSHRLGQLRHALESQGLVVDRLEVQTAAPRQGSSDAGGASDDGRSRGQFGWQQRGRQDPPRQTSPQLARSFRDALIDSVA